MGFLTQPFDHKLRGISPPGSCGARKIEIGWDRLKSVGLARPPEFGPPLPIVAGGKDSQTGRTEFRGSGHDHRIEPVSFNRFLFGLIKVREKQGRPEVVGTLFSNAPSKTLSERKLSLGVSDDFVPIEVIEDIDSFEIGWGTFPAA